MNPVTPPVLPGLRNDFSAARECLHGFTLKSAYADSKILLTKEMQRLSFGIMQRIITVLNMVEEKSAQ